MYCINNYLLLNKTQIIIFHRHLLLINYFYIIHHYIMGNLLELMLLLNSFYVTLLGVMVKNLNQIPIYLDYYLLFHFLYLKSITLYFLFYTYINVQGILR